MVHGSWFMAISTMNYELIERSTKIYGRKPPSQDIME